MIVLVIGGTRSGKSEIAERLAAGAKEPVTVIVPATAEDESFAARIEAHRARRPEAWTTVECGDDLVGAVAGADGAVLVDSLGTWVARAGALSVDRDGLVDALKDRASLTIVVSEEVGLAVHAPTEVGRRFTDELGELNLAVGTVADEVLLVVAGRVLRLETLDELRGGVG
jgi:adenosyl cobinamide kinase/adenosyl cobinamide phosphate guanylyltransferase